ncbi:DUF547 domain-containing protein [Kordiimonas sp. SCSIO 12610]|uniref:DUF547 domain-containing protein n=1 Tax=Kordiimonas sp. SCSIO 12610 TaxID=2829597 RepID=UPI00210B1156|nr:DUF547 domain-containing protein [Kordiimonas sp. SCSIO 12610]UTW55909.1 DUF547 domain-containing protein [Kordiimonas sp. SCSIO 12610]
MKLTHFAYAACMILLTWDVASAQSGPKAIEYWTAHNPNSTQIVDHSVWDRILQKYIQTTDAGLNLFDYGGVSAEDKEALENYLDALSDIKVTDLNREEQRAYWINAYNAITVNLVIDEYPVSSIRKINGGLFNLGPWKDDIFVVEDKDITLDNIEHGILRPIWNDPRTHYSVNCASYGCPNLVNRAWTAENMEHLLEESARIFINSDRGIQKISGNRIEVSSIYSWFKDDFGGDDKSVIEHLKKYAEGDKKAKLEKVNRISDHDYDWNLNTVK